AGGRGLAEREGGTPFDLSVGPLFRASLVKLGEQDHVLLLNTHHIVFDGWSRGVLVKEISSHYSAFLANQTPHLPELPIQYADYAIWQLETLSGEELDKQ